ncbi:MAG: hypothetical protein NUV64_03615 [Parcubacteria group bacterium]|nr:hypothetical protein [Parcubacteria group bacterium]MCR4342325.1 hypothetical protein [Patescibacteria group bacterium]
MKRLLIKEKRIEGLYEVALGLVTIDSVKYSVDLIRKVISVKDNFLVGSIRADDKEIWHFKNARYNGICVVTEVDDTVVLCFLSHSNELEWIVPLEHLRDSQIIDGEMVTAMDVGERLILKQAAAKEIGAVVKLSPLEEKVSSYLSVKRREKEEAERLERSRLKEERRAEIMARESISAYTETGAGRFGKPVTADEWPCLPNGTRVILVESFNKETGECGPTREAFIIRKGKGGRIEKENASEVASERPAPKFVEVKAKKVIIVDMDGAMRQIPVYKTTEEIELAKKAGLNGGSMVTSEDQRDEKGRYLISSLKGPVEKKLGSFMPL